jgi:hypothetical protein
MANFSAQPPAGRQLPRDWQAQAARNAAEAQAQYEATVCQQWRQPLQGHAGLMQAARLQQQPPNQQLAPRRDARADTRMDGTMQLISEDDQQQVWRDWTGAIVTIRKKRK